MRYALFLLLLCPSLPAAVKAIRVGKLLNGDGSQRTSVVVVVDGDRIEITSGTIVLSQAGNGGLWVYHDRRYRSQDQPDAVRLQTADTVEWLLPKRSNE